MKIIADVAFTVNDEEFMISPLPAFKGLIYLKKLTKIIGPSMATALSGIENKEGEVPENTIEKSVELLVQNFEGEGVELLIKDFIGTVTKNGQPINFDLEFRADYGKLFKLVLEVIKVNYGSVFTEGGLLAL